jgi:hypothetical protein
MKKSEMRDDNNEKLLIMEETDIQYTGFVACTKTLCVIKK